MARKYGNSSYPRNLTGYIGVTFEEGRQKYRAKIRVQNKLHHIGYFLSAEEAAWAYDDVASDLYGCAAVLNFYLGPEQQRP